LRLGRFEGPAPLVLAILFVGYVLAQDAFRSKQAFVHDTEAVIFFIVLIVTIGCHEKFTSEYAGDSLMRRPSDEFNVTFRAKRCKEGAAMSAWIEP
jgi:hypothetical protein